MLADKNIREFLWETASDKPVPGGGSVAAMCSSLASALVAMVANLTAGKKKFKDVEDEMKELAAEGEKLVEQFTVFIDRDAAAFSRVMEAFRMPKNTEEEKEKRFRAIQAGLKEAAETPLQLAQKTVRVFDLVEAAIRRGNPSAVTDAAVALMLARTAILSALYNTEINLASIKDESYVTEIKKEIDRLRNTAVEKEKLLLKEVKL